MSIKKSHIMLAIADLEPVMFPGKHNAAIVLLNRYVEEHKTKPKKKKRCVWNLSHMHCCTGNKVWYMCDPNCSENRYHGDPPKKCPHCGKKVKVAK